MSCLGHSDRAVIDAVCRLPEKRRYLRNLVPWAGFRHEPVWYDRHPRAAGETKYSPWKLVKLAGDALVLSSDAPLRLTWAATAALAVTGVAATAIAGFSAWLGPPREGLSLAAVTAVASLVAAMQTAAVAIVGEYVARTYREVQGRPPWVVRRTIGPAAESRAGNRAA